MAKRPKRHPDDDRTELLDQDELFVLKGRGDRNNYFAWLHEHEVDCCPLCGGKVIKIQDHFSNTYRDYVIDDGNPRVIYLIYEFFKYRCLNERCRHIFAKEICFASKNDNVTFRLEDAIAHKIIEGYSYSQVTELFQETISRQAVGQIFHRWQKRKEELRSIRTSPSSLAIVSGESKDGPYTLFLNLDDGIKIFDIQFGISSESIGQVLRRIDLASVKIVLSDCNPSINDAISDYLPGILHIIPVELWLLQAKESYRTFAHNTIKWSNIPRKDQLIMIPRSQVVYSDEYNLNRLLEARPKVKSAYDDYSRLMNLIERRDELWVFEELQEWADTTCDDIKECMALPLYLLEVYHNEIKAQTQYREVVPERLSDYLTELESLLSEAKVFSDAVLKARALYSVETDLKDWHGIPIETVIAALGDMNIAPKRKRRSQYDDQ